VDKSGCLVWDDYKLWMSGREKNRGEMWKGVVDQVLDEGLGDWT